MGHAESGGRAAEFSSLTVVPIRETDAVGVASPVCKIGIRFFPQVEPHFGVTSAAGEGVGIGAIAQLVRASH